jgi:hypothetical protein
MLVWVWPPAAPPDPICDAPVERAAQADWSVDVSCLPGNDSSDPLRGPARILFGLPIDLNHADVVALQVLPGIGPGRAAAIVAARSERPLSDLADLEEIRGIGPKTVAGLSSWATIRAGGTGEF